jgi:PhnB protein
MSKGLPEGLHTVTPQLTIDGASDAIEVYKKAFGAEEIDRAVDPSGKKIWHATLQIGNSRFFVNDAFPEMGGPAHTTHLWVYSEDVDAGFERARAAGLSVKMELADMFWGDRMGSLADRWGNVWNLAMRKQVLSPEEMKDASADAAKKWQDKLDHDAKK